MHALHRAARLHPVEPCRFGKRFGDHLGVFDFWFNFNLVDWRRTRTTKRLKLKTRKYPLPCLNDSASTASKSGFFVSRAVPRNLLEFFGFVIIVTFANIFKLISSFKTQKPTAHWPCCRLWPVPRWAWRSDRRGPWAWILGVRVVWVFGWGWCCLIRKIYMDGWTTNRCPDLCVKKNLNLSF